MQIEIDLYDLAKGSPEAFKSFWEELKKELTLDERHKSLFESVFCHGYCKCLDDIARIIENHNIKPMGEC